MPDERPTWAVDALDNPAADEFDDLEPFDPENGDAESSAVALSRGPSKVTPEDQAYSDAKRLVQAYKTGRQIVDTVDARPYSLPETKSSVFEVSDIANFLFGDEMASIGMSLDEGEVRWKMETAVQQWSEHPIRTSLAWAGWALPGIGKLAKVRRAKLLDNITDTDLIKSGKFNSLEEFGATDDATKLLAKQQLYHDNKYQDLLAAREHAPETMSVYDKTYLWFLENFGHQYSKLADPSSSVVHNINQKAYMNRVLQEEVVDPFLKEIPDSIMDTDDVGKFLLGKKPLSSFDDEAKAWVSAFENDLKAEQAYAREIGMITDETHEKIGDLWVPLIRKDMGRTQRGKEDTLTLLRGRRPIEIKTARLESDAFKERMTGLDEFGEMMDNGEVFGDPKTLTMQGLMEQKMLIMNHEYIRDIAMNPTFAKTGAEIKDAGLDARKWISLDEIPGNHRIRRMIGKQDPSMADKDINIRIDMFEGIFGKNGVVTQSRESLKAFESLVAVHKTVKTALNPFTHGQNLMGNVVFLSQAGFRMFTGKDAPENWKAITGSMRNINEHYKAISGKIDVDARNLKGITVGGRKFSAAEIADELENPWVQDIIEQGSFLKAEGSNGDAILKIADKASDMNDYLGRATRAVGQTMESSVRMYNIEDAGPKFAYYLHNRAKGLTAEAAATEVARRLPIYHGTAAGPRAPILGGLGPGSLKKWALPWISFPAEAARITKNNLIDHPLRMAGWMHAPQMMQSMVYAGSNALGVGQPMTYEDYGGVRRGLPIYGQKPSAVVLPFRDRNNDFRAAMLDFIPHFSFYPATEAKEASFREANPQDIAPILSGMMDIIKGEGPFGRPIQPTSKADLAGKFVANAIGFVTPPYVQKYFFNITSPREQPFGVNTYRLQQDMGTMVNPSTGKPGSWLADLLVNNTIMRNYPSSPEQELFNNQLDQNRSVEKVRGEFTRRFNANARSGNVKGAANELVNIMQSFNKEYTPGATAQLKYSEWLVRHARQLHRHPQLKRYSLEDLQRLLIQNIEKINKARNVGLERSIAAIKREFMARQMK